MKALVLGVVDEHVVEVDAGDAEVGAAEPLAHGAERRMVFVAASADAAHGTLEPAEEDQVGFIGRPPAQAAASQRHFFF